MKPERLEELLWERADGTITPDELAELEAFLTKHPESKDLDREISRLAGLLTPRDEVAPPAALRERIDRALATATPPDQEKHTPRAARPHRWDDRWPARLLPVAASLVLGVAIGYLLHPETTDQIDGPQAAGAMRTTTATAETAPAIVDLGADTGRVVASRVGTDLVIDIGLVREVALRLELEAEDGEIRLTRMIHSADGPSETNLEDAKLTVRLRGPGTQRIRVALSEEASRVLFRATADGTMVIERWIE